MLVKVKSSHNTCMNFKNPPMRNTTREHSSNACRVVTEAVMVPNTWYPDSTFFQNSDMVAEYLKMFGGTKDAISADVAEAFSAGQVLMQAVTHNNSLSNSDLETYLHSGATFQSVQGPVMFGSDGQNVGATPYIFQWQHGTFVPVLPTGGPDIKAVEVPKPAWGSGG